MYLYRVQYIDFPVVMSFPPAEPCLTGGLEGGGPAHIRKKVVSKFVLYSGSIQGIPM